MNVEKCIPGLNTFLQCLFFFFKNGILDILLVAAAREVGESVSELVWG